MKQFLIILITLMLSSCSKNDEMPDQIIGKWKLIQVQIFGFGGLYSEDYSNKNIVYEFQSNGVLIVSGGKNEGYSPGKYNYFFGQDHLGGSNDPKILLVKINDSKWTYGLKESKMTLGKSYVDGPNLIFTRK